MAKDETPKMSRELAKLKHIPTDPDNTGYSVFDLKRPLAPRPRPGYGPSTSSARETQTTQPVDRSESAEDLGGADTSSVAAEVKALEPVYDKNSIFKIDRNLGRDVPRATSSPQRPRPSRRTTGSVSVSGAASSQTPDTLSAGTPASSNEHGGDADEALLRAISAASLNDRTPVDDLPRAVDLSSPPPRASVSVRTPASTYQPETANDAETSLQASRVDSAVASRSSMGNAGETEEQIQNKMINEEYKIWKKNCVFLYDIIYSRALEWPTLTTQWLPDVKDIPGKPFRMHRMIIGSHTSNQSTDHLQIVHINIPNPPPAQLDDYNPRTEELGDFGASKEPMKLEVVQKIVHPGEVNKARYQPQNPNLIATWSPDHNVYVWDRTKHDSIPSSNIAKPNATLKGHTGEGFALEWNPFVEGQLLSGADDTVVNLWDLPRDFNLSTKQLKPARTFTHHSATVNDLQYHPIFGENLWGSVSDDQSLQILDLRSKETSRAAVSFPNAHPDAINTLSFHPTMDKLVATAGADKTIAIFDLRFPKHGRIHTLNGHKDSITKISWHPTDPAILASAADDRRIIFWDISRAGMEQLEEDVPDGPPEMLFMHGGHTNRVSDFGWNANDEWVVVSAAEDNLIQVWRASRGLVEKMPPGVQRQEVGEA